MEKENLTPSPEEEKVEMTAEETAEVAEITEETAPEADTADEPVEVVEEAVNTEESDITHSPEYTYTSRKDRRKGKGRKKSEPKPKAKKASTFKARYVVIPTSIVAVLAAGFIALPMTLADGVIANNVYVKDINLSGLTQDEAEKLIATEYEPLEKNFSVVFETETDKVSAEFTAEEIEYATDIKGTAEDAYNFGRSGKFYENSWNILRSYFVKADIGAKPSFNEEVLSGILYNLGAKVHGEGEDIKITVENNLLSITPATAGQSHNVGLALSEFSNSVRIGKTKDIPVTLINNASDKLDADKLYKELSAEAKDAEYVIEGNEVIITDHVVGLEIDKAKLSALVDQVNNGIAGTIDVIQTIPEITTESIQSSLFGTTLATYSSNYSTSSANRAYNVELAASKINGLILPAGAEFSYNDVVGNANAANGFKMATIFADGKTTEGVGGGVCQTSSTLYCAVLRADLEVVERHNHSLPISYVPGGQDATVSYGVLDFRFKNNTGAPIKIVATSASRNLTVSILGPAEAKKIVEVSSQKVSSVAPTMKEVPDPTLPVGTTKVVSQGKSGSVYVAYKRVLDANGNVISQSSTRSTYRATPGEILVGTATSTPPAEGGDVPTGTTPDTPTTPDAPETPDTPATPEPEPAPAEPEPSEPVLKEDGYPEGL